MSTSQPPKPPAATDPKSKPSSSGVWASYLALNASTGALLGAILLVSLGSELWSPFMPKYMEGLSKLEKLEAPILLIALYGSLRDFLEGVNYLLGGWIAGRFNTRRGLLLFNAAPLIGLVILMVSQRPWAVLAAVPFVFVWDSLAGPALLTVVGDSLPPEKRAMAFSLQSLLRRMAKIVAYGITSLTVLWVGTELGMRAAFVISFAVVAASLVLQGFLMKTASKDSSSVIRRPLWVLKGFHPQLKRLLIADMLARLAEGMPRELIIIFSVPILALAFPGDPNTMTTSAVALYGTMLIVSQITSAITYLPMGALASKPGFGKRPYIGLTFFFFASFPAVLAGLGLLCRAGVLPLWTIAPVMGVAFVFMGMREVGEPARKAMIVDLIPPEMKTQSIGIYWAARCAAVMIAPLVGGAIWIAVNLAAGKPIADTAGPGPVAMLLASSLCGVIGVIYFYGRFGKGGVEGA